MRPQFSNPSRAFRSGEVIVRFALRMIVLAAFAAFAAIGFGRSIAALLLMSTVLSAILATIRRELPLRDVLNHWDEAAASLALCCLVSSINQAAPA
jgi:hypothetical protein